MGTHRLRVPASRVGYVPDAQVGLPPGPTYCTYGVHVPASGVGYVPGTVATQVEGDLAVLYYYTCNPRVLNAQVRGRVRLALALTLTLTS